MNTSFSANSQNFITRVGRRCIPLVLFGIICLLVAFLPYKNSNAFNPLNTHHQELRGRVISVADGDTLRFKDTQGKIHKVRLYGIDCPEKSQAYGKEAKNRAEELLMHQEIHVNVVDIDRYKRSVGIVFLHDEAKQDSSVQEILVREGLAWVYPQYCRQKALCTSLEKLQNSAANPSQLVGLWQQDSPLPPWEYRKNARKKRK